MSIKLFSVNNPDFKRGRVVVVEDGMVVADGNLSGLVMIDDGQDVPTDVYMHPIDAATFEAWLQQQNGTPN